MAKFGSVLPPDVGPYHYVPTEWICILVSCVLGHLIIPGDLNFSL